MNIDSLGRTKNLYTLKGVVSLIRRLLHGCHSWLFDARSYIGIVGKIKAWSIRVGTPALNMLGREIGIGNEVLGCSFLHQHEVVNIEGTTIFAKYKLEGIQSEVGCEIPGIVYSRRQRYGFLSKLTLRGVTESLSF